MAESRGPRAVTPGRRAREPEAGQDVQVAHVLAHPAGLHHRRHLEVHVPQAMTGPTESLTDGRSHRRARHRGWFRPSDLIPWALALGVVSGCSKGGPATSKAGPWAAEADKVPPATVGIAFRSQ